MEIILLFLLFLHSVNLQIQFNLYLTDWTNENNHFQHDCLNVAAHIEDENDPRQIISYCMSEWPSSFQMKENTIDQKFAFSQLYKQHVTSEQLYLWSASIDLIEEYQNYLDSGQSSLDEKIFYNCTFPYFGSQCQYILDISTDNYSSLNEIIYSYYYYNTYRPTELTCYEHFECHRGPLPACLDWTEICDGKMDCLNGRQDEEHCWQLEIHQCSSNEFQCSYGQCIPKSFRYDNPKTFDCLDRSDDVLVDSFRLNSRSTPLIREPTFMFEDSSCARINAKYTNAIYIITSSCVYNRQDLLLEAFFSITPNSIKSECWMALQCFINILSEIKCSSICQHANCQKIIENTCPSIIYLPPYFGHVYLVYEKSKLIIESISISGPTYVCFNIEHFHIPDDGKTFVLENNHTCRLINDSIIGELNPFQGARNAFHMYVSALEKWLHSTTILISSNSSYCHPSIMYQCMNSSKIISKTRLLDIVQDCYYLDDESPFILNMTGVHQLQTVFKCEKSYQYIPLYLVNDNECNCILFNSSDCSDEDTDESYFKKTVSFQTLCDGYTHLLPQATEDTNETDETNCSEWPKIHVYNRCDGFWHLPNGADELNCDSSLSILNCSSNEHVCLSSKTYKLICLPIEKANNGQVDCLGAADEPTFCQRNITERYNPNTFYCGNILGSVPCINGDFLCDTKAQCVSKHDELVCTKNDLEKSVVFAGICKRNYEVDGSDISKILCRLFANSGVRTKKFFTFDQSENFKGQYSEHLDLNIDLPDDEAEILPKNVRAYQPPCHRGLRVQVWLDKPTNSTTYICLCPPSFYGNHCQYQNQRVSLTLQFHVSFDSIDKPFTIIILLIDNSHERIVYSFEQLTYLFLEHCQRKFNIYLLYSKRPKDLTQNYSIHLDIYEKETSKYRGSFIHHLNFPFLPVHRLAFSIDIPNADEKIQYCSIDPCINGKCIKYLNNSKNERFCQCNHGWSGQFCTIQHTCQCSSNSFCLDKSITNRSICLCRLNQIGPRCLITNPICKSNDQCSNHGQCIPVDEYAIDEKKFTCICEKDYSGSRCQTNSTQIILSFNKDIILPSLILIHFIEVKINAHPIRTTTYKTILIQTDSIIIYWSLPFHLVFIELTNRTYYLIHREKFYRESTIIRKSINSFDQCLHVFDLVNETMRNASLLFRMKSYQSFCQKNSSEFICFYDKIQFCFCQQSLTNCFHFEHQINLNCSGKNPCRNGGRCFQELANCPRITICECPICYHGRLCQFNSNGFSLLLDSILSYHIQPNINLFHQPSAVLVSSILSIIILLGGFLNGILLLTTFKSPKTHDSSCGIYLLCSSIVTLLTMIFFGLKFWIFIISQMNSIRQRTFLNIQCISLDFLLRCFLIMDQWLTAFVAVERAYTAKKRNYLNANKRKRVAKWSIMILIILAILSSIHDPIYRSLLDEFSNEEKRIWCIVNYSSKIVQIVIEIIDILHFILPFSLNIISAIFIVVIKVRQQVALKTKMQYKEIIKQQIQEHKNLLIGPCVLFILGIPRLIISFSSGCMKSTSDSWLFLVGYLISFIPSLLTFVVFVLPSTLYKQEFTKGIDQYRKICRRY